MKFFIRLLLIAIVWAGAFAQAADLRALGRQMSERFPHILVDVRGSRGGNGDVAAAYLTVADWLENYGVTSEITFLIDRNGRNRLENISKDDQLFQKLIHIRETEEGLLKTPQDLYLVLANPSGTYRYQKDFGTLFKLTPNATLIVQTVLGNTENTQSLHTSAIVENHGRIYDWSPAGLGARESGIYTDLEAQHWRSRTYDEIRAGILERTKKIEDNFSRAAVESILGEKVLSGARVGLAYGISSVETKPQFISYLRGLSSHVDESYVLITPSAFRDADLKDSDLRKRVVFVTSLDNLPKQAAKNKIYIVETKALPHSIFVALTAFSQRSGVVPVGAGDGFLSAAIELGGPFVLTKVDWNKANIDRLAELLLQEAFKSGMSGATLLDFRHLLSDIYGKIDFSNTAALYRFANLFAQLKIRVPSLSERLSEVALGADKLSDTRGRAPIVDLKLQESMILGGRTSPRALPAPKLSCSRAIDDQTAL